MTEPVPFRGSSSATPSGRWTPPWCPATPGWPTFARLPRLDEVSEATWRSWACPFDSGVSYRPGARFGPAHIRQRLATAAAVQPGPGRACRLPAQQVADAGDIAVNPFNIEDAIGADRARHPARCWSGPACSPWVATTPIALPMLRAVSRRARTGAPWSTSTRTSTRGTPTSAPPTRTARRFAGPPRRGCWTETGCLHVGIRGPLYFDADLREDRALGFEIVPSPDVDHLGVAAMSSASAAGRRAGRCTSRSISTCSIRRTRPAPARLKPADSPVGSC